MENNTTLLNQKKKKITLLHYAMGAKSEGESNSAIIKSLSRNKEKEKPSKSVK